jgi:hypothetical protein
MTFDQELILYLREKTPTYPSVWFESFPDKDDPLFWNYTLSTWIPFTDEGKQYKRIVIEVTLSSANPNNLKQVNGIKERLELRVNDAVEKVQQKAIYQPTFDIPYEEEGELILLNDANNKARWLVEVFRNRNCTEVLTDLPITKIN